VRVHQWSGVVYATSRGDVVRRDPASNVLADLGIQAVQSAVGAAFSRASTGPHFAKKVGTTERRIIAIEIQS
jgi:hypothetical protein